MLFDLVDEFGNTENRECQYDSISADAFEAKIKEMETAGFEVVLATSASDILIDFDGPCPDGYLCWQECLDWRIDEFNRIMGGEIVIEFRDGWTSRGGQGYHAVVELIDNHRSWRERSQIALQLGSDRVREILANARFIKGIKEPWMLFKPGPHRVQGTDGHI